MQVFAAMREDIAFGFGADKMSDGAGSPEAEDLGLNPISLLKEAENGKQTSSEGISGLARGLQPRATPARLSAVVTSAPDRAAP